MAFTGGDPILAHTIEFVGDVETKKVRQSLESADVIFDVTFRKGEKLSGVLFAFIVPDQHGMPTECCDIMEASGEVVKCVPYACIRFLED